MLTQARAAREVPQQPADGQDADQRHQAHLIHRNIVLGARQRVPFAGLACPGGSDGAFQATDHRLHELDECPDGGHGDGAGAHVTHIVAPGGMRELSRIACGRVQCAVVRHPQAPADEGAHEHGDAAADAHQVANAEQRKGELEIEAGDRRPWVMTQAEAVSYVPQEQPRLHHHQEQGGDQRTHQHRFQALAAGFHRILVRDIAGADLDDLGAGGTLGIGQIRLRHQRAAQWDGIHDSEDAARSADGYRLPIGKAAPPPDHDEAGQHEDDGGERAGGGSHRLHDVVLLGGGVTEPAQHRHGDHHRRDGGGESEPSLQPEVDVGGGENHGEHHAQDKSAQRELDARFRLRTAQRQLGARFRLHRLTPKRWCYIRRFRCARGVPPRARWSAA